MSSLMNFFSEYPVAITLFVLVLLVGFGALYLHQRAKNKVKEDINSSRSAAFDLMSQSKPLSTSEYDQRRKQLLKDHL